ncbi:MAG: alpha/beta hydrolase [Rhodospirillaceae bacterium]|jgi:pimeloyl-ACP methyl ester carboxylesterase|nr:alpha/beta hydrolase [Rhodospirillaceae bacterium]MBT5567326.1 alpha/beta hydrolase [Rhodospirillaceae bacterium]MBT6091165.1 alpha/beta hydrolase [Rhodospirillaceae bacterium]MBT6959931.1 alpha/beta hydrolase [Rhodospirillaceae bacterium]MBT7452233.1 alpha/beta hydrolase [Rhodospirillaceae bacterium]
MLTRRTMMGGTAATAVPLTASAFSDTAAQAAETKSNKGAKPMDVDRAFVRIEEGLVHYRHAGEGTTDGPLPLYMMHAGPGSSKGLTGLVAAFGETRRSIAPDTLGFGESVPPTPEEPDLIYYADSVVRIWDMLGLDKVDVYGGHTGANIGMEIAIAHPDRVRKLVFDGVALFDPALAADMLENYAPKIKPQANGEHFIWAWNFMRDMGLYFPYYMRDKEHYLGKEPWPTASLHSSVMEVMKALDHYYKGYNAVFRHKTHDRLPLVTVPTFCMAHEADPLHTSVEEAAALVPNSEHLVLPFNSGTQDKADAIIKYLDA